MKKYLFLCITAVLMIPAAAQAQWDISEVQFGWDGYIHLYENSFDPNNQLNNLIAANDDGFGGIGTSDLVDLDLQDGTVYWLVTSGFAAGDEGKYTWTISGPGDTQMFNGSTEQGPFWNRPIGVGPDISTLGPVRFQAVTFAVTTVPEPASCVLLAVFGSALLVRRRR